MARGIRPVVSRAPPVDAAAVVTTDMRGLVRLPGAGAPGGRTEFASITCGSSQALDDGTTLGALVLRGAALVVGLSIPDTRAGRRALWVRVGVVSGEVSTTVSPQGSVQGERRPRPPCGPAPSRAVSRA